MPPQSPPPPTYSGQPAGPPGYPSAPPPSPGYGYGQQPPAMPAGTFWDAPHEVAVPNGTTLASRGRRIGAWFLAIPLLIVTLVIGYLIWGLIVWGRGQTPALQVLGMRCWRMDDGKVASWGQMALREVVGRFLLSIIPFEQIVSFVVFLATKQRRAIHDYVAGTIVVHDPNGVFAPK